MWYWTKVLFLILVGAVAVWFLYEVVTFPNISKLKTENPTTSSMIEYRISEAVADGREPRKYMIWMPIEQISPNLQKAVLAGEDARFFEHHGFDWDAIQNAWDEAQKQGEKEAKEEGDYDENDWIPPMPSFKRGASTISQQLAKNLFLYKDQTYTRKVNEWMVALQIERLYTKRKILEMYMNYVFLGAGSYGFEAGAQTYFG